MISERLPLRGGSEGARGGQPLKTKKKSKTKKNNKKKKTKPFRNARVVREKPNKKNIYISDIYKYIAEAKADYIKKNTIYMSYNIKHNIYRRKEKTLFFSRASSISMDRLPVENGFTISTDRTHGRKKGLFSSV